MNRTANDLLEEYRCADFNKRLHLYLQYPGLRPEFLEMDRNGLQREAPDNVFGLECFPKIRMGTFFNPKTRWVRRLFGIACTGHEG
jgi:hypothetical protein